MPAHTMAFPTTMSSNKNLRIALMNIEANVNRAKSGDPDALDRIIEIIQEYKGEPTPAPTPEQEPTLTEDIEEVAE